MKNMVKLLALVMAVFMLALPVLAEEVDQSLQGILDKGKLILGLDDSFPPMGFRDEDNNIVGYDIDVAKAVCDKLGIELVCQPIDWGAKDAELNTAKNIDCIWNGMSITDERLATMAMSMPYMNNQIVMIAKDSAGFASYQDLAGKNVAVQTGSFAEEVLETYPDYADFYASVKVAAYDDYLSALMDLQQGGVDGVLIDLVVAEYRIAQLGDESLVVIDALEDDLFGIGFRKDDVALRDKVNEILVEFSQDGTLDAICQKWFGKNISIVK